MRLKCGKVEAREERRIRESRLGERKEIYRDRAALAAFMYGLWVDRVAELLLSNGS